MAEISEKLDEYGAGNIISPKNLNLKVGDKGEITFIARKGTVEFDQDDGKTRVLHQFDVEIQYGSEKAKGLFALNKNNASIAFAEGIKTVDDLVGKTFMYRVKATNLGDTIEFLMLKK
jgi:hypothetical protein